MEMMDRAKYGESLLSFQDLFEHATHPKSHIHQPRSSSDPCLVGFYEASLHGYDQSNHLILKEVSPEYSLEGLMLKLKLYLAT